MTIQSLLPRVFSLRLVVLALAVAIVLVGDALPGLSLPDQQLLALIPSSVGLQHPLWAGYVVHGALVFCLGFLVLLVPSLSSAAMALVLTLLLAVCLVVVQWSLALYQQLWLPLGQVTAFLILGFAVMVFWMQPQREIRDWRANARDARYQLGKLLLQQGRAEEARDVLRSCPPDNDTLDLQYDIAIAQERKRQYDAARDTYQDILNKRRRFRDVAERLSAMQRVISEAGTGFSTGFDATRTLVMPDQAVSKPTLGRYEIEREIGRGAMGVVYLGKDPKIARTVAIKTLSYSQYDPNELPALKTRFYREAEAAGRLNHPAIVTVYDVGEEADLAFIAMDFAPGKPLSAYGKTGSLLPLAVVLKVVAQAAEALDYAHGHNIVHRDIKPGNLIYDDGTGKLKITDFGIAKITDDSKTRTGTVMGSPLYMSPEQLKGQKVTGASDIYSLGVTLYKLVSGETPYNGDNLANLTYQILNKRPRSVREFNADLPDGVVRLINKAIQKDPAKRFASAGAMADALRRAAARIANKEVSA